MEREARENKTVLRGLGESLERLVSSLASNNNVVHQVMPAPTQVPTPLVVPANTDVARQAPPQSTQPVLPHPAERPATVVAQPAALPPPHTLVAEENRDGTIDRIISKEDYRSASNHGKLNYNELGMAKPYMFLYRPGLQTPKQKLDLRAGLSMIEYINSTLLLLQDSEAFRQEDLPHIMAHLTAVTTDAMARPWAAVRAWSQYIWDCVEKGKCKWDGYQFIQDERVRMSFISGTPSGDSAHIDSSKSGSHDVRVVLCRDYNSVSGCRFHSSHEEQNIKHLHACSHCDAMGCRSSHSYQRCRSKMELVSHTAHAQHDNRQWHQGNARQHYSGQPYDAPYSQPVAYRNGPNAPAQGSSKNM